MPAQPHPRAARADVASILNATSAAVGERPVTFVLAAAIYTAISTWLELQQWSWHVELALIGATTLLAGLMQYAILMRTLAPAQGAWARILTPLTAVVIHLLVWTAASFALLLLVLPGCYLAGRMSAAIGIAVAERGGVLSSIAESWRRTRASAWSMTLVQLLLTTPLLAAFGLVTVWAATGSGWLSLDESATELAVLTNVMLGLAAMVTWAVAVASYRLTADHGVAHDAAVFA